MRQVSWLFALFIVTLTLFSCKTQQGIFGKKSSFEKYADQLKSAGLHQSQMAITWEANARKSLESPLQINLPYKETAYLPAEKPLGAGFRFAAQRGDKLIISLETRPLAGPRLFSELWFVNTQQKKTLLHSADTILQRLEIDADAEGHYLFRLQAELLVAFSYTLTIETGPSLGFPVSGKDASIGSFWGVDRDGGSRRHEGIDIFARKGTPALAAADGRVTRVNNNNLGGKIVFMSPHGRNLSLYYAHLDSQLVSPGQQVSKGDVIGLVGNTGNAKNTNPHLHFGIYTTGGAIDPLPFVNTKRKQAPVVSADTAKLLQEFSLRNLDKQAVNAGLVNGQYIQLMAATADGYRVQTADGTILISAASNLNTQPIRKIKLDVPMILLADPSPGAAIITTIESKEEISVLGLYGNYRFVQYKENKGWMTN